MVAYHAQQAWEALQLVTWGLTDVARETFAPALDLLMAVEHARSPYLSERGKQHVMEIPRRDTLPKHGPAHPELVDTLMSFAGQASQVIVMRAMQEMVADGDYDITEEAVRNTWAQECCCATLYRFDDGHAQYCDLSNTLAIAARNCGIAHIAKASERGFRRSPPAVPACPAKAS